MIKLLSVITLLFLGSAILSQERGLSGLNELSKSFVCKNIKKSDSISEVVIKIATENENYDALGFAYKNIGANRVCKDDFTGAIKSFSKATRFFDKSKNRDALIRTLYNLGVAYRTNGKLDSAMIVLRRQLKLAREIENDTLTAYAYVGISDLHSNKYSVDSAAVYAMKALKIAKKNNIYDIKWRMNFSLGRASQGNEDYEKALEYYQDVRPLIEKANDTKSLTYLLNNIAGCYLGLADYENAIAYYTQNLEVSKKAENRHLLAASYSGLAHVYSDKDEYPVSNKFYLQTLKIVNEIGVLDIKIDALSNLCNNYYQQGNYIKAIEYGDEAIKIAKETGYEKWESDTYKYLYLTNKSLKNYTRAIECLERHLALEKDMFQNEKENAIVEFQTQYDVEKKELLAKNAIKEKEILEAKSQRSKSYFVGSIIIAILILIASLFFFGRLHERKKAELVTIELRETQKRLALEKQYRESELKALKSQMNPHFIFNALNSIQEYIVLNKKNEASDYLGKFADLIRTYLSHSDSGVISLQEEIDSLKMYLDLEQLRFEDTLEYSLKVSGKLKSEGIYIPTMLVQPYIENSLKHGLFHVKGPRILEIVFTPADGNNIQCVIEDNGVGREKAKEFQKQRRKLYKSFATKATQERLDLLNYGKNKKIGVAVIDLFDEDKKASGTKVILTIPNTHA